MVVNGQHQLDFTLSSQYPNLRDFVTRYTRIRYPCLQDTLALAWPCCAALPKYGTHAAMPSLHRPSLSLVKSFSWKLHDDRAEKKTRKDPDSKLPSITASYLIDFIKIMLGEAASLPLLSVLKHTKAYPQASRPSRLRPRSGRPESKGSTINW